MILKISVFNTRLAISDTPTISVLLKVLRYQPLIVVITTNVYLDLFFMSNADAYFGFLVLDNDDVYSGLYLKGVADLFFCCCCCLFVCFSGVMMTFCLICLSWSLLH